MEEIPAGEEAISTAPVPGGEPGAALPELEELPLTPEGAEPVEALTTEAAPQAGAPTSEEISEMDMDAAFAWLESLAVKQGADEALLLTPEERQDTPPEWVTAAAEAAPSGVPELAEEEAVSEELETPEETGHPGIVSAGLAAGAGLAAAALLHGEDEAEAQPAAEIQPVEIEQAGAELQPESEVQAEPPELLGEEIPVARIAAPLGR